MVVSELRPQGVEARFESGSFKAMAADLASRLGLGSQRGGRLGLAARKIGGGIAERPQLEVLPKKLQIASRLVELEELALLEIDLCADAIGQVAEVVRTACARGPTQGNALGQASDP